MWTIARLAILGGALFGARDVLAQSTTTSSSTASSSSLPVSSYCTDDTNPVCASVNVPEGSEDTYFSVIGSAGGWTGVGVGGQMAGALMFVVYPGSGSNVTVSPRLGRGHVQPLYEDSIEFELLEGSGIVGDTLTANIKCSNCRSWSGGTLDASSTAQDFIYAIGGGTTTRSTDPRLQIQQHSSEGTFALNMASASGGDGSVNPFIDRPAPTTGTTSGGTATSPVSKAQKLIIAHGVLMSLAWVILFPLGAAIIRFFKDRFSSGRQAMVVHRALQIGNFLLVLIALALGCAASDENSTHFTSFHQYFGVILVALVLVQGALGALHHQQFAKTGKRSVWSHAHIWFGRALILAGIINGGLGLALEDASGGETAAYSVIAVIVFLAYAGYYAYQAWRPSRRGSASSSRLP